jgi:hypothetical protein
VRSGRIGNKKVGSLAHLIAINGVPEKKRVKFEPRELNGTEYAMCDSGLFNVCRSDALDGALETADRARRSATHHTTPAFSATEQLDPFGPRSSSSFLVLKG